MTRTCGQKRPKPSRKKIVLQVIFDHGITEKEFFSNSRLPHIVSTRKDAIIRLDADGAYASEIAKLIGREASIIRYHLLAEQEKDQRAIHYADWWKKLRADPVAYENHLKRRRKTQRVYYARVPRKKKYESQTTDARNSNHDGDAVSTGNHEGIDA
jgi:hypothetical protein